MPVQRSNFRLFENKSIKTDAARAANSFGSLMTRVTSFERTSSHYQSSLSHSSVVTKLDDAEKRYSFKQKKKTVKAQLIVLEPAAD